MKKVLVFSLFLSFCLQSFAIDKEVDLSNVKVYRLKEGTVFNSPLLLSQPLKPIEFSNYFSQYSIMVHHYPTPNVATVVSWTYPNGYEITGELGCKLGQTTITINHDHTGGNHQGSFLFTGIPVQPNVEQRLTWIIGYNGGYSYPKFIWHGSGVGPICTVTCQPGCSF